MNANRIPSLWTVVGLVAAALSSAPAPASADVVNTWAAITRGTMIDHYDVDRSDRNLGAAAYEFAWLADVAYSSDATAAEFVADRGYALVGSGGSQVTGGDYKLLRDRSRLILTVRGSSEPLDWLTNAVVQTAPTGPYLGAHTGFAAAAQSLIDDIRSDVDAQLVLGAGKLVVVGHSLGGSVGQLLAHRLEALGYSVERVVTFGSPAAGRSTWSSVYANMNTRTHGFQDHRDLVACLPPDQVAWTHNGALHEVRDAEIAFDTPTDCSTVAVDVFNVVHGAATGSILCGDSSKPWRRALGVLHRIFNPAANATCEATDPVAALIQFLGATTAGDRPLSATHHGIESYIDEIGGALDTVVRDSFDRSRLP